jgi:MOSC domain-containing protein YiiM
MSTTKQKLQQDDDRPTLAILGIFAKCERPRKNEICPEVSVCSSNDVTKDQIMVRKRLEGLQEFVPEKGLVSESSLLFFHSELNKHYLTKEDASDPFNYPLERTDRIYEERSVLIQSLEHYQKIKEHSTLSMLMPDDLQDVLNDVRFGENMIVSGLDNTQICVGDIFRVPNGESSLKLQVSSPRLPCCNVDMRNGSPYGANGLRRFTMSHGLAGWFVRVLKGGMIREGMTLVRSENPHPKWTLEYVSRTLYAEGDRSHYLMCRAQWARSRQELEELCALEALGWFEWKAEAQWLLDRWGREDVMVKQQKIDTAKRLGSITPSNPAWISSSLHTSRLLTIHLHNRCSHWVAVAFLGLAWLTYGISIVVEIYRNEE